ncbi:hypothetical protein B0H13DRAFT_1882252 [Mycena leptocephala]|nr:hypothetical protein B0H13DRAFT_1882252 [Mycena leptocephala]
MDACINARLGNQAEALKTVFFQLCNLQEAPVTLMFVLDGPGRPEFNEAPGEAEAELAHLNKLGLTDAVITEESDAVVFGQARVPMLNNFVRDRSPSIGPGDTQLYLCDQSPI